MISLAHKFVNLGANGYASDRRPQRDEFVGLNRDSPQAWNLGACWPMWGGGQTEIDLASGYIAHPTNCLTVMDPLMGQVYYGDNGNVPRGGGAPTNQRYYNVGAFGKGQSGSTDATGYPRNMDGGANVTHLLSPKSCSWTAWVLLKNKDGYILNGGDIQQVANGGNNPPNAYIMTFAGNNAPFPGPGFAVSQISASTGIGVELDIDGGSLQSTILGNIAINDGNWHLIAGVYTPNPTALNPLTDNGGTMQVFVDGVLDVDQTNGGAGGTGAVQVPCTQSWLDSSSWGTCIGADTDFVNAQFNGMFCDFRFYLGRALTAADLYAMWHPDTRWELYRPRRYYSVWLPDGGNFFTATAADSPATTDAASRLRAAIGTATDAPATVDTAARIASEPRTTTDTPATVDTAVKVLSAISSAVDAPGTTDSTSRLAVEGRAAADTPATVDTAAHLAVEGRTAADAPDTVDTAIHLAVEARAATDAPATTDSASRLAVEGRTAADAPATADVASRIAFEGRTAADTPTTTDIAGANSPNTRSVSDAFSTVDLGSRFLAAVASSSDAPQTADTAIHLLAAVSSAVDAPHTADTASRLASEGRAATDAPGTADSASRFLAALASATDAPATTDTASRIAVEGRTAVDATLTTDTASRLASEGRSASDAPGTVDTASRFLVGVTSAVDAPHTLDAVVKLTAAVRIALDAPHTAESTTRLFSGTRSPADATITVDTAAASVGTIARSTTDAVSTVDAAVRRFVGIRSASDAPATTDSAARGLIALLAALDAPHTADVASRVWIGSGDAEDAFATADTAPGVLSAIRLGSDAPFTSDTADRLFTGLLTALDLPTTFDSASAVQGATNRTAGDLITSADLALRAFQTTRGGLDAVQTLDSPSRLLTLFRVVLDTFGSSDAVVASSSGVIVVSPAGVWYADTTRVFSFAALPRAVVWRKSMAVLVKRPAETRLYAFDFASDPAVKAGDTVTSVQSVIATLRNAINDTNGSPSTLTLGNPSIVGTQVRLTVAGGLDGSEFDITFQVGTAGHQVLVGVGTLDVEEDEG